MSNEVLIWAPTEEDIEHANVTAYMKWLKAEKGLSFSGYRDLWQWSVDELEDFWESIWQYFDVQSSTPYECVLRERTMPGAEWFPGARLNFAEHCLRGEGQGREALVETGEIRDTTIHMLDDLAADVRVAATRLREWGVGPGDMVAAYMPNIYEATVAVLATTAIGATWSTCSPDFGTRNVLDRFEQLQPKVLFCADGYRYRGKAFDRLAEIQRMCDSLDCIEHVVMLPYLNQEATLPAGKHGSLWADFMDHAPVAREEFAYEQVPFDHPLWVLFSSGTTGLPKGIVHCHGGIILEHLKLTTFHKGVHKGNRMFFFTTTGWMMWNFLVASLLCEVVPVMYDGHPSYPDDEQLWRLADEMDVELFGTSPTFVLMQEKAGVRPIEKYELKTLKNIFLAGSPASPANMAWFGENVKKDLWVQTGSGGTDICAGFVGGVPIVPSYGGEMQGPHLGVDVCAFNDNGEEVVGEVGEMVIRKPMPSMPVSFWNDPNRERYIDSYFSTFPGVWRQGDFFMVNERGGCFVLGRSDATLNRQGIRIGTAEIYLTVDGFDEVLDSLVVNLDLPGGKFFMPLFVKLADGVELSEELSAAICAKLRADNSPRHVPDKIYAVDKIPMTLTGKKMEVPVRKILMGFPIEKAANVSVMQDPSALDYFIQFEAEKKDYPQLS